MKLLDLNSQWFQKRPEANYCPDQYLHMSGYHEYFWNPNSLTPMGASLHKKSSVLEPRLKTVAKNASVLDLGCGGMYFMLLAEMLGATEITGVEIDKEYAELDSLVIEDMGFDTMEVREQNIQDIDWKSDIVLALSIVHWIYSCSAGFGSLENVVKFLSGLTKRTLFVEWVDKQDQAMQEFGHTNFNHDETVKDYNIGEFRDMLDGEFSKVEWLGDSKKHRHIYMATK